MAARVRLRSRAVMSRRDEFDDLVSFDVSSSEHGDPEGRRGEAMTKLDADVVIVGYGPVGQTAAALLASRGHRVAVYERYGELYALPRAVYFDDGTIRVWQALGVAEDLMDDLLPASRYD